MCVCIYVFCVCVCVCTCAHVYICDFCVCAVHMHACVSMSYVRVCIYVFCVCMCVHMHTCVYLYPLENCQAHLSGNSFPCCLGQGRAGVGFPSQGRTNSASLWFTGDRVSGEPQQRICYCYTRHTGANRARDAEPSVEATGLIRASSSLSVRSLADFLVPSMSVPAHLQLCPQTAHRNLLGTGGRMGKGQGSW